MTEEERAAKAARAKAMLKKRQQQKKSGTITSAMGIEAQNNSPLISRTSTPAQDFISTHISNEEDNTIALSSSVSPDAGNDEKTTTDENMRNAETQSKATSEVLQQNIGTSQLLQDHQQTISLLVSEKASLAETVERLVGVDNKLQQAETVLEEKTRELAQLRKELAGVEIEREQLSVQYKESSTQNTHLLARLREKDRDLLSIRSEVEKLQSHLEARERRTKELEEQIQNDDRVEILEAKVKNTQDRAEEVSYQLSKLKQNYDKLRSEYDSLNGKFKDKSSNLEDVRSRLEKAEAESRSLRDEITEVTLERDRVMALQQSTISQLHSSQSSVSDLENKLSHVTSDLTAVSRQLEDSRVELNSLLRRAEEAEKAQKDLQEESSGLMNSLNEMRPKIIELTSVKLELTERIEQLNNLISQRDSTIAELEADLEASQNILEDTRRQLSEKEVELGKEKEAAEQDLVNLQKALSDVQKQLEDALFNVREIDTDRGKQRQTAVKLQEELRLLLSTQEHQQEELNAARVQLEEREQAGEEKEILLSQLQQDIESLRQDLAAKDEEIAKLRRESVPTSPAGQTLDDEVQSAVKQQFDLELSTAQSRIRSLETSLFDAEAQSHSLQRQIGEMEDELTELRSINAQRSRVPGVPGSGRHSTEMHRSSFASQRSDTTTRYPPSALIDQNLPSAIRHQRHVSLAMLQARMFSEAEAATLQAATSKSQSSTHSGHHIANSLDSTLSFQLHWPQFLDESHVFWCANCKGDLIVL